MQRAGDVVCPKRKYTHLRPHGAPQPRNPSTFTPGIDLEGKISINHRPDVALTNALNTPGFFEGDIIHRDNIGKQMDDLVGLWNEEHPEDLLPVEG